MINEEDFTRDASAATHLVVLDGEQHESMGILLKKGLVGLLSLDARSDSVLDDRLDRLECLDKRFFGLDVLDDGSAVNNVLLANRGKVDLLGRGIGHLEILNVVGSLLDTHVSM